MYSQIGINKPDICVKANTEMTQTTHTKFKTLAHGQTGKTQKHACYVHTLHKLYIARIEVGARYTFWYVRTLRGN